LQKPKARIDAYFTALRETELRTARKEELRAADDCIDAAELEKQLIDTKNR
jgi:hypothetical protein